MYVLFYLKSNRASTVCVTHVGEQEFGWRKAQRSVTFRTFSGTKCSLFQAPRVFRRGAAPSGQRDSQPSRSSATCSSSLGPVSCSSFSDGGPSGLCWSVIK